MNLRQTLAAGRILLLDGAMGTMLQAEGQPAGVSPERFCMDRPDILKSIHERYLEAGCDIVTTCTFGGNLYKLDPTLDLFAFNQSMARVAREACAGSCRPVFVAGNLGPSGQFIRPLGNVSPLEFIAAYRRQVEALLSGGVDCFLIETQFDLAEARALVIAVHEVTDLPILVSMTFEGASSLTGSSPEIFAETMQNLGCDVIGTNCSLGPAEMAKVLARMQKVCDRPLMAEPNAGLPTLQDGVTVFPLGPEAFVAETLACVDCGVQIVGGCCGTSPAHIALLKKAIERRSFAPDGQRPSGVVLTSRGRLVRIAEEAPFVLIGERINPTGKKTLSAELAAGSFETCVRFADEEVAQGADVLDVNVGAPLVDETVLLPGLVELLVGRVLLPLSLDSSNALALERALPYCPGSALLNSISGEGDRLERLAPLCARYGAPFVLLPLMGKDLPVEAAKRIAILERLLSRLDDLAIPRRLVLVDILALTVSANAESARECLKVLSFCREQNLPTTLGLSNISFGLPARELLNASFLCMARGQGLCSCIANPASLRVQEAIACINVFANQDPHAERFIARYATWKTGGGAAQAENAAVRGSRTLSDAVVNGDKEHVQALVEEELEKKRAPFEIVNEILIPAITEVGARYERKEYFLPQLIRSAETMQTAFALLKPLLEEEQNGQQRPVIIMATVEGDIHDIGKNIVSLMLSNHGFEVIDLGKDVPASTIVESARAHNARLIGLSALMTTTMVRMQETIDLVQEQKLAVKVLVGGACVTQSFADSIGADAYCEDAVTAVSAAKRLVGLAS